MKKFRLLSMALALLMIVTMFAGCGKKQQSPTVGSVISGVPTTKKDTENKDTEKEDVADIVSVDFPESLNAEKIGSADFDYSSGSNTKGLIYKNDNDEYGIMSLDGKTDTGAKYAQCSVVGDYFIVINNLPESIDDIAALNCAGVVDVNGNEIIPMKYAAVNEINERYIRVYEVTEPAANKEEGLVYFSEDMFSFSADDDDLFFKGNWYVYDMIEGKMLEGVTGTKSYNVFAYGNLLKYVTDDEEQIIINEKGEKIPENADVFDNGCYSVEDDDNGTFYNSDKKKLFDYDVDDFAPFSIDGEYIIASRYDDDGSKYVLMNMKGKIVSAEFTELPSVYGELLHSDDKVYDFDGNVVIEGTYDTMYMDEQFGGAWLLKNGDESTLIKNDGTVLYQGEDNDDIFTDPYDFNIEKDADDGNMYFCFSDNDFTLNGYALSAWLVQAISGDYYNVVDAISGKTIIGEYDNFESYSVPGYGVYVYAEKEAGGYDIYFVK